MRKSMKIWGIPDIGGTPAREPNSRVYERQGHFIQQQPAILRESKVVQLLRRSVAILTDVFGVIPALDFSCGDCSN
jgi:hypothetical protein